MNAVRMVPGRVCGVMMRGGDGTCVFQDSGTISDDALRLAIQAGEVGFGKNFTQIAEVAVDGCFIGAGAIEVDFHIAIRFVVFLLDARTE